MKLTLVLVFALLLIAPAAMAQYPRGVISELATATWCQYCPNAYAGLEVMKSKYDTNEFTSVRWYSSSGGGGLSFPGSNARVTYYNVTGFPTAVFDGTTKVVGADASYKDGHVYDPIVAREIGSPSPLKIRINSVNLVQPNGSVNLDIIGMDTIADISSTYIRIVVLENNVTYNTQVEQDVARVLVPDVALTVSGLGQIQNVIRNFTLDPTWKTQDLYLAVFVQNDKDQSVLQSASTRPAPDYSPRFWAKGPRVAMVPSNGQPYDFPQFGVYNLGTKPDVIRATLNPGTVPAGWSVEFTDGVTKYSNYVDLSLAPGEGKVFYLEVTPNGPGSVTPYLDVTSANLPGRDRLITYSLFTNDVQVLIVADDGGAGYSALHADAIQAAGYTCGIWPTDQGDVTAALLKTFRLVDWECGLSYPTLTLSDQAALTSYFNGGGALFLTGQDIGWEMDDNGGQYLQWYNTVLHASFVLDNAGSNSLTGVPGDPIGAGMSIALTPSLNPYPDAIAPADNYGTVAFTYDNTSYNGVLRVDTGVYKIVYLGFGFEAITSQDTRRLLMQRSLAWFKAPSSTPELPSTPLVASVQAFPNPAPGGTSLSYTLPAAGSAVLRIYEPDGTVVRTLSTDNQSAGRHIVRWDGRDNSGRPASAGIYFYRLEAAGAQPSGKLVLTR